MGMCRDPLGKYSPSLLTTSETTTASRRTGNFKLATQFLLSIVLLGVHLIKETGGSYQDAVHITAILGESVVFNCHVEFPEGHPVPYVLQWEKKVGETKLNTQGQDVPIYIWYESYPTHSGEGYEGRVSRVSPDSPFGAASLNLTSVRESDQGWYECKVVFLDRSPNSHKNGTWFHLDVHAPPRFTDTPADIIYVNVGDAIILSCAAEGTPTPEILWYKDSNPIETTVTIGIFNDGTELRISTIRHEDIGDYTCMARNGEGQISHTARVIIAGGAVIMVPPTNQTRLEGEKVQFACEASAQPGNVTVKWYREGAPVKELNSLETRVSIRRDGSLVVNPVSSDDSGQYLCEVSNGIGEAQSASAHLNVEYPAKVTFTPTIQYLPFRLAGVVQCYIAANPPLQYVTWTKDKRLLEPYQTKDIVIMNNGSLLFTRVNEAHQGRYTCTPYNAQGTQGSSAQMEVLVRKPPVFTVEPDVLYQRKVGETVEMVCDAQEAEGTDKVVVMWQRRDGVALPKGRVKITGGTTAATGGNITIENLRRSDFGFYQCIASNEVATIVTATQLVVEGTKPHAPYNVTGNASEFAVTLSWLPGYSGGADYKQDYTIWYRESNGQVGIIGGGGGGTGGGQVGDGGGQGAAVSGGDWSTIPVTPSGSTQVTINRLAPGTTYEFQVIGKNTLGDGMMSKVITIRTIDVGIPHKVKVTPTPFSPHSGDASLGEKPGMPRNLTVTEISNGFLITWQPPLEKAHIIQHYSIKYKTDGGWKTLNKAQIRPEDTQYLVKNLVGGRTYYFRILAYSPKSYESSEEVKFSVPARVKHKAITAGVVGGFLFFIVAIILSVCAVKICNKRKRRKQEKAYNLVACRITDARNGCGAVDSQVPLKKFREERMSSTSKFLSFLANWIWPKDRCLRYDNNNSTTNPKKYKHNSTNNITDISNQHFINSNNNNNNNNNGSSLSINWQYEYLQQQQNGGERGILGRISRAPDGRFILIETTTNNNNNRTSNYSSNNSSRTRFFGNRNVINCETLSNASTSSDDGGFLRQKWRLNTRQKISNNIYNNDFVAMATNDNNNYYENRTAVPTLQRQNNYYHNQKLFPIYANTTILFQSSPDVTSSVNFINNNNNNNNHNTTASLVPVYFSDLSSVPYNQSSNCGTTQNEVSDDQLMRGEVEVDAEPETADVLATDSLNHHHHHPSHAQLRSVHERYSQELPSLSAIHEECHNFGEVIGHGPGIGSGGLGGHGTGVVGGGLGGVAQNRVMYRNVGVSGGGRLLPRYAHIARSAPELGGVGGGGGGGGSGSGGGGGYNFYMNNLPYTHHHHLFFDECSPASRSSSSGFGSKNTSSQQNSSGTTGGLSGGPVGIGAGPIDIDTGHSAVTNNDPGGFNSENTWQRLLPPYKPPPPPPLSILYHPQNINETNTSKSISPPSIVSQPSPLWLELDSIISNNKKNTNTGGRNKYMRNTSSSLATAAASAIDVGSVDGHYEFDPATPTTSTTPTGSRDIDVTFDSSNNTSTMSTFLTTFPRHFTFMDLNNNNNNGGGGANPSSLLLSTTTTTTPSTTQNYNQSQNNRLLTRYNVDDIDARVQAMKREFNAFRLRQAKRRRRSNSDRNELESAC